jgi:protein-tyrosine phosphatase
MDISQITDYLYVGTQPKREHLPQLLALDVRLIISMRGERRPPAELTQPPLTVLWLRTFDTFFTPIPIHKLMEGVRAALPVIRSGGRVLAHCHKGRHRSVAMAAAILIAMGHTAEGAMRLLRQRRKIADPHIWYVRWQIKKFEKEWRARSLHMVELPQSTRTSADAAQAVGCAVGQIAKSIVFRAAQSDRPVLVIASGANRVSERAGFALMASLAWHDKTASDAVFLKFLPAIRRGALDERNFVKKAVNWALRQIGKRSRRLNRAAIRAAREIQKLDSRAARWVAADALRELTRPTTRSRLRG